MIGPRIVSLYALVLLAVGAPRLAAQTPTPRDTAAPGPGTFMLDRALAHRGYYVWRKQRCWQCHDFGKSTRVGPDLRGVMLRHGADWLRRWLSDTDKMLQSDSAAIALMVAFGGVRMPQLRMTPQEVEQVLHFIARESELPVGR